MQELCILGLVNNAQKGDRVSSQLGHQYLLRNPVTVVNRGVENLAPMARALIWIP